MHNQHARTTALDGVIPRQITLQNGIPVFVRDDLRLHGGIGDVEGGIRMGAVVAKMSLQGACGVGGKRLGEPEAMQEGSNREGGEHQS